MKMNFLKFFEGEQGEKIMFYIMGGLFFLTSIVLTAWIGYYISHKNDLIVIHDKSEDRFEITEYGETQVNVPLQTEEEAVDWDKVEVTEISPSEFESKERFDSYKIFSQIALDEDLQVFTQIKCEEYEVSYPFVLALMESESSFRKDIGEEKILGGEEGGARYYGYMQLSASNCNKAKDYGLDAHTPEGNIEMGILLLSKYITKYDSIEAVVTAYKAGEGAADSGKRLSCGQLIERMNHFSEIVN